MAQATAIAPHPMTPVPTTANAVLDRGPNPVDGIQRGDRAREHRAVVEAHALGQPLQFPCINDRIALTAHLTFACQIALVETQVRTAAAAVSAYAAVVHGQRGNAIADVIAADIPTKRLNHAGEIRANSHWIVDGVATTAVEVGGDIGAIGGESGDPHQDIVRPGVWGLHFDHPQVAWTEQEGCFHRLDHCGGKG